MRGILSALVILAVLSIGTALANERQLAPSARQQVIPPYDGYGVAAEREYQGTQFRVTECPTTPYDYDRTVKVIAPASLDLMNARIANGILIRALYVAWRQCFVQGTGNFQGVAELGGVRVLVFQKNTLAIETDRISRDVLYTKIAFGEVKHYLAEKKEAEQRARDKAERQAANAAEALRRASERAAFWSNVRLGIFVLIGVGVVVVFGRYAPRLIAYIQYALNPHGANYHIERATRGGHSSSVDGRALATALRTKQSSVVATELATRDLKNMTRRVEKETEYLRASEELGRKTVEMERLRARVDELKNAQERS